MGEAHPAIQELRPYRDWGPSAKLPVTSGPEATRGRRGNVDLAAAARSSADGAHEAATMNAGTHGAEIAIAIGGGIGLIVGVMLDELVLWVAAGTIVGAIVGRMIRSAQS